MTPSLEVIHLVYRPFDLGPLRRFVDSYRAHGTGLPHRLTIAFKGFADLAETRPWSEILADVPHDAVLVPNRGLDIGTYLRLATQSDADLLCLLNSRSVILADNWLAKLHRALAEQGGGAVGATGSWQGFASDPWRDHYHVRTRGAVARLQRALQSWRMRLHYPPFPNPHLRTNGLLIARSLLLGLRARAPSSKEEAMRFESGWRGLTRQVLARGLPVAIVGRDGRRYAPGEWAASATFWQEDQAQLLIGDNQTDAYLNAGPESRAILTEYAWHLPAASKRSMRSVEKERTSKM